MNLSSQGQRTKQQVWCIASFSFSLGSQNEHACYPLYWTFDQAFYPLSNRNQPPLLSCLALEELSGRWPATSVPENGRGHRFILRTWSSLTTLRGLVRRNWTKKRECSTGTTSNHRTQLLSVEPAGKKDDLTFFVDSLSKSYCSLPR